MIKGLEAALSSDLAALDKWEVLREESDMVGKLLKSGGAVEGCAAVAVTFFDLNRLPRYLARHAARVPDHQFPAGVATRDQARG